MSESPSLTISQEDFQKITAIISNAKFEIAELLEEELSRAKVVPASQMPPDTVSMGSQVTFVDLDTNEECTTTLVYPHESDIHQHRVSILAPVGAALIGLRVGQTINWPLKNMKVRRLKVTAVSPAN